MIAHDPEPEWVSFNARLIQAIQERDRARRLAAHLEEVVAMRTTIVRALADRNPDERPDSMPALQAWARAQLQEIP